MAPSTPDTVLRRAGGARARGALLGALLPGLALAGGATQIATTHGVISYDAAQMEIDVKSHQAVLRDVVVSQGELKVKAQRADATALEFQNSRWIFSGNVIISAEERGTLHSDRATVEFSNNQLAKAVATGSPAEFEQTSSDTGQLAQGQADTIEYNVEAGTVQLTDNASVTYGGKKVDAARIVYDIREKQVQAAQQGGDGKRVVVTIDPKQDAKREPKP